ncbi:MAG: NYN domain-containing protein [Coriobacteriales bacterium]
MQNDTRKPRLALLIDADNISAKYLPIILNEVPKYGIATFRRIYGDFTDPQMASWRPKLLDHSITPIQQFSNVKSHKPGEKAGKNATDSTLIIDAMDILYGGKVDGFVIVSSDSDFTRLAARLRESSMIVIGMGRNQTSVSFRHACTTFVNIEYLYKIENKRTADIEVADTSEAGNVDAEDIGTTVTLEDVADVIGGVIHTNDNKGRTTTLSEVGDSLNTNFPDFDVRNYGYSRLSKLVEELDRFELVKTNVGYDVRIADTTDSTDRIAQYMILEIGKHKGKTMSLSALATLVYDKFPNFAIKDTGYTQFYKFVNSINGITVTGNKRKQAKLE